MKVLWIWLEGNKMSNERTIIVGNIRKLGESNRGKELGLLQLSDDCLYEVYLQLKAGVSNRSIARMLQSRYGVDRSENSIQQTVSLLAKRIAPILNRPCVKLPVNTITPPPGLSNMPTDEVLDLLEEIMIPYGQSIKHRVEPGARHDGYLTEDVSKHVKVYATLVATREKLQRTQKRSTSNHLVDHTAMDRRSKLVLEKCVCDDGEKMIRSADKFLKALEAKCVEMEINAETGEYEVV
jgi:tRNA U54 and U55 pseudouridine synthase Pus10